MREGAQVNFSSMVDTLATNNGVEIPRLGLGTYKTPDGDVVEQAVRVALEHGYRHVDTASLYGNEEGIGRALKSSDVPRDDVFVTTKVWNDEQGYEKTLEALQGSLERLSLDYLDLYLVHWPIPELSRGTWMAMEDALDRGLVRAIGVCNHLVHHLDDLIGHASVVPAVNQVEFHFRLQQPELVDLCSSNGTIVEAWAPLMRGRIVEIPEVNEIAARHGATPFQVAIRWVLQRGVVAIPKSVQPDRIISNASVMSFALSDDEMMVLDGLDTGERIGRHPDDFADAVTRPHISRM